MMRRKTQRAPRVGVRLMSEIMQSLGNHASTRMRNAARQRLLVNHRPLRPHMEYISCHSIRIVPRFGTMFVVPFLHTTTNID